MGESGGDTASWHADHVAAMSSTSCSTGDRSLGDSSPPPEEVPLSATDEASPSQSTPASHAQADGTADHAGGFEFDLDLEHHDPVVRLTEAYERGDLTASLLERAEVEALQTFVVRAETEAFDVRSNPDLEAAVRIARSIIHERHRG
ncbi:hypothetical protein DM826_09405 [Halonotius aquaticus]|jgi:hypothetical protein|uniref:Uncharacterized protein n=2 Tax=Halonotius aquaticus TaxID=2216978 RepID=A0A3A6PSU4_9EURY|nr:hypothetical protein DM826_09405 [Halonotius aquaticus]